MMPSQQLDICDFRPAAFRSVRGEEFVIEGVAWGLAEVFCEDGVCGWNRWEMGMDGGLEGADGLLLQDVAGEKEEGCEDED